MSEIQWNGDNIFEIKAFMSPAEPIYMSGFTDKDKIVGVMTPDGLMVARINDWITKNPAGEHRIREQTETRCGNCNKDYLWGTVSSGKAHARLR